MVPLKLSANALARAMKVPPNRITAIISGTGPRAVTPDTALRLARYFGTTPRFWLNLQLTHDLALAEHVSGKAIVRDIVPLQTA